MACDPWMWVVIIHRPWVDSKFKVPITFEFAVEKGILEGPKWAQFALLKATISQGEATQKRAYFPTKRCDSFPLDARQPIISFPRGFQKTGGICTLSLDFPCRRKARCTQLGFFTKYNVAMACLRSIYNMRQWRLASCSPTGTAGTEQVIPVNTYPLPDLTSLAMIL